MRKLIPILLLAIATVASAATPEEFEQVINFDDSIETLAELVRTQQYDQIDVNRFFILQGSVASTQVYSADPSNYQAVIELVSSRWIGLERIQVYHVYVFVDDPKYAPRLPERMPRDPGPEVIQTNQQLLVVGPFIGTYMLDETLEIPVVQAVAIR